MLYPEGQGLNLDRCISQAGALAESLTGHSIFCWLFLGKAVHGQSSGFHGCVPTIIPHLPKTESLDWRQCWVGHLLVDQSF